MYFSKEIILKQVINTFDNSLSQLSSKHRAHWCLRRFRVTGDRRYLRWVYDDFKLRSKLFGMIFGQVIGIDELLSFEKRLLEIYPKNIKVFKPRFVVYSGNQGLYICLRIVEYIFRTKYLKLTDDKTYKTYYNKGLKLIKQLDYNELLFNSNLLNHYSSGVINTVYYLKYLEICDLTEKLKKVCISKFATDRERVILRIEGTKDFDISYRNKIYALTHLIIASSYYYQKFVDPKQYYWVLKYFERNIDEIINRSTIDIVAEVGLCFKLCKKDSKAINIVEDYLIKHFDSKVGYITNNSNESLDKAEHRNAVSMMFLSDIKELKSI